VEFLIFPGAAIAAKIPRRFVVCIEFMRWVRQTRGGPYSLLFNRTRRCLHLLSTSEHVSLS
jgi:hypothetical protein